jgi:hypothetical protein
MVAYKVSLSSLREAYRPIFGSLDDARVFACKKSDETGMRVYIYPYKQHMNIYPVEVGVVVGNMWHSGLAGHGSVHRRFSSATGKLFR